MDLVEGVGESSSPPRSFGSLSGNEIANDVYNRLVEIGNEEAINHPGFREQLEAHFNRLPASYALDINLDRVEDVLLHQKLLVLAKDPEKRPVFHVRLLEFLLPGLDNTGQVLLLSSLTDYCFMIKDGAWEHLKQRRLLL